MDELRQRLSGKDVRVWLYGVIRSNTAAAQNTNNIHFTRRCRVRTECVFNDETHEWSQEGESVTR